MLVIQAPVSQGDMKRTKGHLHVQRVAFQEENPELRAPESFIRDINTDPFAKTGRVGSSAGRRRRDESPKPKAAEDQRAKGGQVQGHFQGRAAALADW